MRDKINYLKEKHVILLCLLIAVGYLTIFKGIGFLIELSTRSKGNVLQFLGECIGLILAVTIMELLGKRYILKEKGEGIFKGLFVGALLSAIYLRTRNIRKTGMEQT